MAELEEHQAILNEALQDRDEFRRLGEPIPPDVEERIRIYANLVQRISQDEEMRRTAPRGD